MKENVQKEEISVEKLTASEARELARRALSNSEEFNLFKNCYNRAVANKPLLKAELLRAMQNQFDQQKCSDSEMSFRLKLFDEVDLELSADEISELVNSARNNDFRTKLLLHFSKTLPEAETKKVLLSLSWGDLFNAYCLPEFKHNVLSLIIEEKLLTGGQEKMAAQLMEDVISKGIERLPELCQYIHDRGMVSNKDVAYLLKQAAAGAPEDFKKVVDSFKELKLLDYLSQEYVQKIAIAIMQTPYRRFSDAKYLAKAAEPEMGYDKRRCDLFQVVERALVEEYFNNLPEACDALGLLASESDVEKFKNLVKELKDTADTINKEIANVSNPKSPDIEKIEELQRAADKSQRNIEEVSKLVSQVFRGSEREEVLGISPDIEPAPVRTPSPIPSPKVARQAGSEHEEEQKKEALFR